jgi:hypothetical protein
VEEQEEKITHRLRSGGVVFDESIATPSDHIESERHRDPFRPPLVHKIVQTTRTSKVLPFLPRIGHAVDLFVSLPTERQRQKEDEDTETDRKKT